MSDIWQVQDAFWNSFAIPAYDDQTQSEEIGYPHLTYESFDGSLGQYVSLSINLWYRESSWAGIKRKAEQIRKALVAGVVLSFDDGYLWLKMPDSAVFAQPLETGSEDAAIKRIVLTVEAEALST